jgi:hypothetical protein
MERMDQGDAGERRDPEAKSKIISVYSASEEKKTSLPGRDERRRQDRDHCLVQHTSV